MSDLGALALLYVEDEPDLRAQVETYLALHFGRVLTAGDGAEALACFEREKPDVVLSDIRMPGMDGLELAERLRELAPGVPVVLCTAFADVPSLLRAIEIGVQGVVRKPIDLRELRGAVARAAEPILARREIAALRGERLDLVSRQLGVSPAMRRLAEDVTRVAASGFTVLIQGETGVGKTRLASLIHTLSPRHAGPFIPLHLGALPETLLEGELFGYERGAFTGAERRRPGLFQTAHGGTVFLDDVDTIPPSVQAKLLTVVETGRFFPLGSRTPLQADVRVVAASNLDLAAEVAAGRFRQDLSYRLRDVVLTIPPLRDRPEDIPWLVDRFLLETSVELKSAPVSMTEEALAELKAYPWRGNVRELRSTLRGAILFSDGAVGVDSIRHVLEGNPSHGAQPQASAPQPPDSLLLSDLEAWGVRRALEVSGGKRMNTAKLLGVTYNTLRAMLERYRIE